MMKMLSASRVASWLIVRRPSVNCSSLVEREASVPRPRSGLGRVERSGQDTFSPIGVR
jgi:hypothetical protein